MKTKMTAFILAATACIFAVIPSATAVPASTTAFTYQGRLNVGSAPANGNYDLTFALFNDSNGVNQVSSTLTNTDLAITNGLFTVNLDFGSGVFAIQPLWLQIGARTNGSVGAFSLLSPLQQLTAAPASIYSLSAGTASFANVSGSATNLIGSLSANQLSGTIPVEKLPASVVLTNSSGVTLNGTFSGDGSGLVNVKAASSTIDTSYPLPVYNVENRERQSFCFTTNVMVGNYNPVRNFLFFNAPTNAILVIETVSIFVENYTGIVSFAPPATNQYQVILQTSIVTPFYTNDMTQQIYYNSNAAYFPFTLSAVAGATLPATTQTIKAYASSATPIFLNCLKGTSYADNTSFRVSVSGYYISIVPPQTPSSGGGTSSPPDGGGGSSSPGQ